MLFRRRSAFVWSRASAVSDVVSDEERRRALDWAMSETMVEEARRRVTARLTTPEGLVPVVSLREVTDDLASTPDSALAEHAARVSAARALIAVRKRTGRRIPGDVETLAEG